VPGDLCTTELPELLPGNRGPAHLKRCHLADSDSIYEAEVLPEIAPDLLDIVVGDTADNGDDAQPSPEGR
jgi:peptide/nickel transport system ATP-binding protein